MKDLSANTLYAWLGIAAILIGGVVSFANLFKTSDLHEGRIAALEANEKTRALEQAARDEAQRKRDDELKEKLTQRDSELQTALGKISESLNFANWRIGAITDQLKEKKR